MHISIAMIGIFGPDSYTVLIFFNQNECTANRIIVITEAFANQTQQLCIEII